MLLKKDSTLTVENEHFNKLDLEWRSIFNKLDSRDGKKDGVIKKSSFLNWVMALDSGCALKAPGGLTKYENICWMPYFRITFAS